jgi:hypothetical protein
MTKRKTPDKTKPATSQNPNVLQLVLGVDGINREMSRSEVCARVATRGHMNATAMRAYAGFDKEEMSITDLATEIRSNGEAVVAGDLSRVEMMLMGQFLTLDTLFANLAQRSGRQEYLKNMETFMRLALKAQGQARATAEALALIKNPMPYIKQANIAQGHQLVNNGVPAHAGNSYSEQSKLLEADDGKCSTGLDGGASIEAGSGNSAVAALGQIDRANVG